MRSIENLTPLMMFLRIKGILPKNEEEDAITNIERVNLRKCLLDHKADWDVIELLFELDGEMKSEVNTKNEENDLYLFMELAIDQSNDSLKQLYHLVYSAPELLFTK